MQSEIERRIVDGTVWEAFCDRLKQAGKLVLRPEPPADALNRAIGFRCTGCSPARP